MCVSCEIDPPPPLPLPLHVHLHPPHSHNKHNHNTPKTQLLFGPWSAAGDADTDADAPPPPHHHKQRREAQQFDVAAAAADAEPADACVVCQGEKWAKMGEASTVGGGDKAVGAGGARPLSAAQAGFTRWHLEGAGGRGRSLRLEGAEQGVAGKTGGVGDKGNGKGKNNDKKRLAAAEEEEGEEEGVPGLEDPIFEQVGSFLFFFFKLGRVCVFFGWCVVLVDAWGESVRSTG